MSYLKNLAKTAAATGVTATIGTLVTDPSSAWYKLQSKPDWQPPNKVFPFAWSALYAAIAASSATVLTRLDKKASASASLTEVSGKVIEGEVEEAVESAREAASDLADKAAAKAKAPKKSVEAAVASERRSFKRALGLNLVLNAGWSYLFWQGRNNTVSTVEAAALAVSSIDLARRTGKVSKGAGLALVPYAAWTTFATFLTGSIAKRN